MAISEGVGSYSSYEMRRYTWSSVPGSVLPVSPVRSEANSFPKTRTKGRRGVAPSLGPCVVARPHKYGASEWSYREAAGGIPEFAREPSPVYPAGRVSE
jgi:hypothetical protein